MALRRWTLTRGQMLRAMPRHLLWAVLLGAVVGPPLYWLKDVEALPPWLLFIIMGTLWANAAVLPVAIPGKHWSFGFIGTFMLFLALFAGMILAARFAFPHSHQGNYIPQINCVTFGAIITGGCLGLLYGLLVGTAPSMAVGLALGGAAGYLLGLASEDAFVGLAAFGEPPAWRFDSALHFAWQSALAMLILHLAACMGAILGIGPANPQSEIRNPKSG